MTMALASKIILVASLLAFTAMDITKRKIHWIVLPITALLAATNNTILLSIFSYVLFLSIGMFDLQNFRFLRNEDEGRFLAGTAKTLYRGGDAYMMTMACAALGWKGFIVIAFSWASVLFYRVARRENSTLPYAPFLAVSAGVYFLLVDICLVTI